MKKTIFLLLPVLFLSLVSTAGAALISIDIEGTVTSVLDEGPGDGWLDGKINIGDPVIGTYTYDTLTADSDTSSSVGIYDHHEAPCGIFVNISGINGFDFQTDPDNVLFRIRIHDNSAAKDYYSVKSYTNMPLSNGVPVEGILFHILDSTASALSSDLLPYTAPVLDDWQSPELTLRGGENKLTYDIEVNVTSIVLVPEPTTLLSLGLGILFIKKPSIAVRGRWY